LGAVGEAARRLLIDLARRKGLVCENEERDGYSFAHSAIHDFLVASFLARKVREGESTDGGGGNP